MNTDKSHQTSCTRNYTPNSISSMDAEGKYHYNFVLLECITNYISPSQLGSHLEFVRANGDIAEVDLTGVPPCIYTGSATHCTNGGLTYLFWIKIVDTTQGLIFTTTSWTPPREGIQLKIQNNAEIRFTVFRKGEHNENNRVWGKIEGPLIVGSWFHMSLVWSPSPNLEVYYNGVGLGNAYTITGMTYTSNPYACRDTDGRMIFGKLNVNQGANSANFLIDDFMAFDYPMTSDQVKAFYMEYSSRP